MKKKKILSALVLLYSIFILCQPGVKSEALQEKEAKFEDPLWKGENACVYDLVKDETSVGLASFETSASTLSGKKVYLIKANTVFGSMNEVSKITVRAKDLKPIKSEMSMLLPRGEVEVTADYFNNKVDLVAKTANAPQQSMTLSLPEDAYVNEEVLTLLRTIPFKIGLQIEFNNFSPGVGRTYPSIVKVLAEETIQVPAGTFECFKVELSVAVANTTHYIWYDQAAPHYLVMYDNGETIFKLKEVLQDGKKVEF